MSKPSRLERTRKRLSCALTIEKRHYSGIVLDLSGSGLFIQTTAPAEPGTGLRVELAVPGQAEPLPIQARVARRKVVPPRLVTVAQGGLGVRIEQAPEAYYALIAEMQRTKLPSAEEKPAQPSRPPPRAKARGRLQRRALEAARRSLGAPPRPEPSGCFRVRLGQVHGSRSRFLEVKADSEDEARERAVAEVGEGWKVLSCERRNVS